MVLFCLYSLLVLKDGLLNINQIRYFAAVVEHGSLSAAAKSLHITVQAVSKSVADLECEIGCALFVRNSQGMTPTVFALSFYQQATSVLARFAELEAFASSYREPAPALDHLRFALNTPAFLGNEVVRENTAALVQSLVGIETTMALATGSCGLEGLRSGGIDVLVTVGTFNHPDLVCRPVGTVPSAIFMSREHPLAAKEALSLADIAPYPVALSTWFDSANESIVSTYQARDDGQDLHFVDLELNDMPDYLEQGGLIFTTDIPALEKSHRWAALRPFVPEDSVAVPICVVYLKARKSEIETALHGLFVNGLPLLGLGSLISG